MLIYGGRDDRGQDDHSRHDHYTLKNDGEVRHNTHHDNQLQERDNKHAVQGNTL